jgi:hypothetical protein
VSGEELDELDVETADIFRDEPGVRRTEMSKNAAFQYIPKLCMAGSGRR